VIGQLLQLPFILHFGYQVLVDSTIL